MGELYSSISEKRFFSLSEVASLCKVTPAAALYWCRRGGIKSFKRSSLRGKYRIPRSEVLRILSKRRVEVPGLWTAKKRILVIDDYVPTANFIRFVLEHAGIPVEVRSSRTLGDGLVLAGKMEPDLIFVDYGNPAAELQGLQALRAIKQASLLKNSVVVGIATARGCEDEMRAAGARDFLVKALDHRRLLQLVVDRLKIKAPRNIARISSKSGRLGIGCARD